MKNLDTYTTRIPNHIWANFDASTTGLPKDNDDNVQAIELVRNVPKGQTLYMDTSDWRNAAGFINDPQLNDFTKTHPRCYTNVEFIETYKGLDDPGKVVVIATTEIRGTPEDPVELWADYCLKAVGNKAARRPKGRAQTKKRKHRHVNPPFRLSAKPAEPASGGEDSDIEVLPPKTSGKSTRKNKRQKKQPLDEDEDGEDGPQDFLDGMESDSGRSLGSASPHTTDDEAAGTYEGDEDGAEEAEEAEEAKEAKEAKEAETEKAKEPSVPARRVTRSRGKR